MVLIQLRPLNFKHTSIHFCRNELKTSVSCLRGGSMDLPGKHPMCDISPELFCFGNKMVNEVTNERTNKKQRKKTTKNTTSICTTFSRYARKAALSARGTPIVCPQCACVSGFQSLAATKKRAGVHYSHRYISADKCVWILFILTMAFEKIYINETKYRLTVIKRDGRTNRQTDTRTSTALTTAIRQMSIFLMRPRKQIKAA